MAEQKCTRSLLERFEEKIDYNGPINSKTGTRCHIWTGAKTLPGGIAERSGRYKALQNEDGYGRIGAGGRRGKSLLAHRVAWELYVGPIPDGYEIDHDDEEVGCQTKACVNVEHLRPTVTNQRRTQKNTSGEWAITWDKHHQRWRVCIQAEVDGRKRHSPTSIGLPTSYLGDPPPAAPPAEAIAAREKLRAHLGLPE